MPQGVIMTGPDLLRLALETDAAGIDVMAHALGWPGLRALRWRRVKWANPYRNYYAANGPTPVLSALVASGLMIERKPLDQPYIYYHVTEVGIAVVRLRLMAARLAREGAC